MAKTFDKIEKEQITPIDDDVLEMAKRLISALNYKEIDGGWEVSLNPSTSISNIIIPAYHNNRPVLSIDEDAFAECKSLTSITIPDTVTTIKPYAFYMCCNLKTVLFEKNSQLKSISNSAFYGCSSLTEITLPDSLEAMGYTVFSNCSSLTTIIIPMNLTIMAASVFKNCTNLTNIIVDEENKIYKSIDGNLYTKDGLALVQYAIGKPVTSFTIPYTVVSIGDGAFSGCQYLTNITIPRSVRIIGEKAFRKCINLKNVVFEDSLNWKHRFPNGELYSIVLYNLQHPSSAAEELNAFDFTWFKL